MPHAEAAHLQAHAELLAAIEKLYRLLRRTAPATPITRTVDTEASHASRSAVRFWRSWRAGEIAALPYRSCAMAQAYAAYRSYAARTGELPCTRNTFTHALLLSAEAAGETVRGKIMRVGTWPAMKSERMLLLSDPPEQAQGAWATACCAQFAEALALYVAPPVPPRSPRGRVPAKKAGQT
jgi:hypothetical protein